MQWRARRIKLVSLLVMRNLRELAVGRIGSALGRAPQNAQRYTLYSRAHEAFAAEQQDDISGTEAGDGDVG